MSEYALTIGDAPPGVYRCCLLCRATVGALVDTGIDTGPLEERAYLCGMCSQRLARAHGLTIADATLRDESANLRKQLDELGPQLDRALATIAQREQQLKAVEELKTSAEQRASALQSTAATAIASLQQLTNGDR